MSSFTTEFAQSLALMKNAQRILIISHRGPDGDTVGANLALRSVLINQWGKSVTSACIDPPPVACDFLPDFKMYVNDFDLADFDLIIAVDCGASYMMKFGETKPELLSGKKPFINIDHHPSNDRFGTINIVDDKAAAACQIVYQFLKFAGATINRHVATCLLEGLYYDTGSFMHSNSTPEVLTIASELLWKGADFKQIVRKQFHTMPINQLKIYGTILERARVNAKGITVAAVTKADFDATGASPEDTTGIIDYLNSIPEGRFCCLVYEDKKGMLKGSFRTRDDSINLSQLAGVFGGGGHKKASGFSFPGRLIDVDGHITIEDV